MPRPISGNALSGAERVRRLWVRRREAAEDAPRPAIARAQAEQAAQQTDNDLIKGDALEFLRVCLSRIQHFTVGARHKAAQTEVQGTKRRKQRRPTDQYPTLNAGGGDKGVTVREISCVQHRL